MISTVISYCSLDEKFIDANINECLKFSDEVIIVYFDHLLNGKLENDTKLINILRKYQKAKGIKIEFDRNKDSKYHHNLARWIGYKYASNDWLLFLDADEIPDGKGFYSILSNLIVKPQLCYFFTCFWYFRRPEYQSTVTEQCGLLINKCNITSELIFSDKERWQPKFMNTLSHSVVSYPYIHHFSWVRTKAEMLAKVSSWAHKEERDWVNLVEKEFRGDFQGTDFIHGYSYREVKNIFKIES